MRQLRYNSIYKNKTNYTRIYFTRCFGYKENDCLEVMIRRQIAELLLHTQEGVRALAKTYGFKSDSTFLNLKTEFSTLACGVGERRAGVSETTSSGSKTVCFAVLARRPRRALPRYRAKMLRF
jgi:AraC-like DNA-binding protein